MRYLLGDQWFRTKDEVRRKIHDMLYAYPIGTRTSIEDTEVLQALLQNHPRALNKIGCGIVAFEIRRNPRVPGLATQRCFYLIRIDGSEDDFSYLKCITPPSARTVFRSICRRLVAFQVALFKDSYFSDHARLDGCVQCPITGVWVSYEQAHVDHIPPLTFEQLVRVFIQLHSIDEETVALREIDRVMGRVFADDRLTKSWVAYHEEHAKLRVVSAYANTHIIPQQVRRQQTSALTASVLYAQPDVSMSDKQNDAMAS